MVLKEFDIYKIIEKDSELKKHQDEFLEIIKNKANVYQRNVGHAGGGKKYEVYWSPELRFWSAVKLIQDSRYWNAFGLVDPEKNKNLSIVVEINFPISDIKRGIGGVLAKDNETGKAIIAHRGVITKGGKTGIAGAGMQLFWDNFSGIKIPIEDGERQSQVAVIGELYDINFLKNVKNFVAEVDRIKK